jgi:hypothetical protein
LDLRGSATYTFRIDLPANSRVDRLNVTTQQATGTPPTSSTSPAPAVRPSLPASTPAPTPGTFSAYDWQTGSWQPLAPGTNEVELSPAQNFVGPDGSVRIQVASGGADRVVRFLPPELTLQGEAGS